MFDAIHEIFSAYWGESERVEPKALVLNPGWIDTFKSRFGPECDWRYFQSARVIIDPTEPNFRFVR